MTSLSVKKYLWIGFASVLCLFFGNSAWAAPTTPGLVTSTNWTGDHYVSGDFTLTTTGSTDSPHTISYYKLCRSNDAVAGETRGCESWVTSNNGTSKTFAITGINRPSESKMKWYYVVAVNSIGQEAWSAGQYVKDIFMDTVGPGAPGAATTTWTGDHNVRGDFTLVTSGATDNESGVAHYGICRSADSSGEWRGCEVWITQNTGTSYTITGADKPSEGKMRWYYEYAWDNKGNMGTNSTGVYIRMDTTSPTQDALTISSQSWKTDGTATYDITVKGSDPASGVESLFAAINYQGSNGPANLRGDFAWSASGYYWAGTDSTDKIACTGGGYAAKYATGWGYQYITLTGCITALSGTQRTVTFTVKPLATFGSFNAMNDISSYAVDNAGNTAGWTNYDLNFTSDGTIPTQNSLTVSTSNWQINNNSSYTITATVTDSGSGMGSESARIAALINYQGSNSANQRGYFSWTPTSYFWTGTDSTDQLNCTGGGKAEKYNGSNSAGYGKDYSVLTGCTTSVGGNQRTVTFTVKPNTTFGEYLDLNDISLYAVDAAGNAAGWTNYDLNFSSYKLVASANCGYNSSDEQNKTNGLLVSWNKLCGSAFATYLTDVGVASDSILTALKASPANLATVTGTMALPNSGLIASGSLKAQGSISSTLKQKIETYLCNAKFHRFYNKTQIITDYHLNEAPLNIPTSLSCS